MHIISFTPACLVPSTFLEYSTHETDFTNKCVLKEQLKNYNPFWETSLAVQWLQLHTFTAEGLGLIPGWGIKISKAIWHGWGKKTHFGCMQTPNLNSNLGMPTIYGHGQVIL